jgi:dipeptidyl aminopeptidase/acylaminoacyl peptidase
VFQCDEGVCVADDDGSDLRVVPGTFGFRDPDWSPDGSRIAATAHGMEHSAIVVFTPTGRVVHRIVHHGSFSEPRWSPDGTAFAFGLHPSRMVMGTVCTPFPCDHYGGVWLSRTDGGELEQLTADDDAGTHFER